MKKPTEKILNEQMAIRAEYRDHEKAKGFEGLYLAAMLGRIRPDLKSYQVALDAAQIVTLTKRMANYALQHCNYGLTERQEKIQKSTSKKIETVASFYGLKAHCYGDPRGYVVRLEGEGIEKNGWGDGFGVG